MRLYDGTSPIKWAYDGELTADEMRERGGKYELLLSGASVLYDNEEGVVYSFAPLSAECTRFGVELSGTDSEMYEKLLEAMDAPYVAPLTNEQNINALAELGALSSVMLDGLAELGTLVSELKGGNNG